MSDAAAARRETQLASGRDLVFIGGTGRSGTHALAQLLGRHSRLADVPIEARFHCNKRGLPDLLEGRVTLASFLIKLRRFWWHRVRVDGQPRGLYNLMRRSEFDAAVERFEAAYAADPVAGCRGLFLDLLAPVAARPGKPGMVEMSSHNVRASQTLLRLFPEARFIHALRDGRDSAASVSGKTWGPRRVGAAIGWWAERLRAIESGMRGNEDGAEFAIPAERFHVVLLEDLVGFDRERSYERLLDFLAIDDEPALRDFFAAEMTAERAHLGRWRHELRGPSRAWVQRRYEWTVAALEREGNHAAPALRAALDREAGAGR
ncbi:MAG TPA: sulfotransferase [Solirubrobacterales bacterium]|nr:sulfotransferase [Solirubrobacterales bacterium]